MQKEVGKLLSDGATLISGMSRSPGLFTGSPCVDALRDEAYLPVSQLFFGGWGEKDLAALAV